ncbi:hypothetical protein JL721_292 [Aureococcus anophagefferens]|nr:hypothetical protein JL721_292 [Aureococcus anophagefferens]
MKNVDPRWDEELTPIRLKDPSTVIHVMVHDEELFLHNKLLGQWIITAKWLAMDPRACHAYDVERAEPGVLEGWFPLSDAAWERRGAVGFVKLKLKWSYDDAGPFKDWNPLLYTGAAPKKKSVFPVIPTTPRPSEARDDDDEDHVASPRLTALEQLTAQSDETNLKLGSTRNVRAMLETFPFWFAVRAVAVTGVDFWLKDLFAGTTGTGERGSQRDARGVFVPRIYASDRAALRPPAGDAGLTLWRFAYNFVVKAAAPEVVNMTSVRHQAIGQILAGFFARTGATAPKRGGSVATLHEARSVEAPPDARQRGKIGRQLRMKFNPKDKSKLVTRDTRDVNREAALAGALRKTTRAPGAAFGRHWKTYRMELKGGTLFYHEVAGDARVGQELKISLAGLADGGDAVEIVGDELAWRAAVVAAKRALDEAASDDDARRPGAMPSLTVTLRSARGVDDWPAQATQGVSTASWAISRVAPPSDDVDFGGEALVLELPRDPPVASVSLQLWAGNAARYARLGPATAPRRDFACLGDATVPLRRDDAARGDAAAFDEPLAPIDAPAPAAPKVARATPPRKVKKRLGGHDAAAVVAAAPAADGPVAAPTKARTKRLSAKGTSTQ